MAKKFKKIGPYQKHFVAEWREHFGHSQEKLAEMIGTTKATISRLENYENSYSQDLIEAIAEVLSLSPATLLAIDPKDENDIFTPWKEASKPQRKLIVMLAAGILKQGSEAA